MLVIKVNKWQLIKYGLLVLWMGVSFMFVEVEAAMVQQDVIRQSSSTACYFAPGEGSIPGVKVMIESDRCISINMVNVQLSPEEVERNHWYTLTAQEDEAYRQQVHPQSVSFRRRVSDVSLRTNRVEIGSHIFLLFDEPLREGVTYELTVSADFPVAIQPVKILFLPEANVTENIRVNQVGYFPQMPKYAIVGQYIGSLGPLPLELEEFFLIRESDGKAVYKGQAELLRDHDPHTGQKLYKLDFSGFTTPGTYRVLVPQVGVSFPFRIADDVLNHVGATLLRGLVTQRCGYDGLTEDFTRFARPACHTDDAYLDPASLLAVTPANPPHLSANYDQIRQIPTTKGHHDAGDYGKYVVNGCTFVYSLLQMLSLNSNLAGDDYGLPFSQNGIPDVLEEVKWELDWLETMQDPDDGGVFSIVKPRGFGYESDLPAVVGNRWIYPKDTVTTATFAAALAHAARHPLIKRYYPEDAERYLEKAQFAWSYLAATDHYPEFHHYGAIWGDADDRVWAAVELYLTTGKEVYHEYFLLNHRPEERRWGWVPLFASYGNATRSYVLDQGQPKDERMLQRCLNELRRTAETFVRNTVQRGYGFSMDNEPLRHGSYGWYFPTSEHAYDLLLAYEVFGDSRYLETALANMNYELGVNAQSYVQITGLGWKRVMDLVDQQHRYGDFFEPRVGLPLGAGSSGIYHIAHLGDLEPHTYPANYPLLARFYEGWNVQSEFTLDAWARITASYLYFYKDKGTVNQPPTLEVEYTVDPKVPGLIHFHAKASDPDGEVVSLFWDFDDEAWALGSEVSHQFSRPSRNYRVFVRAVDNDGGYTYQYLEINPSTEENTGPFVVYEDQFDTSAGLMPQGEAGVEIVDGKAVLTGRSLDPDYVVIGPVKVDFDQGLTIEFVVSEVTPGAHWNFNIGFKENWWNGPHMRPYGTDMIFFPRHVISSMNQLASNQVGGLSGEQTLWFTFDVRNGSITVDYLRITAE